MSAEGDTKESGTVLQKFPGPVTCDDDDPKKGYFTIHLSVPEIQKSKLGVFGKSTAKNAVVKPKFTAESISVSIECTSKTGEKAEYIYERRLPADIDPESTDYKIKNEEVQLSLCKAKKSESWAPYVKMFIKKEG